MKGGQSIKIKIYPKMAQMIELVNKTGITLFHMFKMRED